MVIVWTKIWTCTKKNMMQITLKRFASQCVIEKLQKTRPGADRAIRLWAHKDSQKRNAGLGCKWLGRAASLPEEHFPCFPVERWEAHLEDPLSHPYIWLSSSYSPCDLPSWKWKLLIKYSSKSHCYGSFIADSNCFVFVIVGPFNP